MINNFTAYFSWKAYTNFVACLIRAHSTCSLNWKSRNNWPVAVPPLSRRLCPARSLPPLAICHFLSISRVCVCCCCCCCSGNGKKHYCGQAGLPCHLTAAIPPPYSALYATVDGAGLVANRINVACLACCWPLKANVIESLTPSRGSNTSVHAPPEPVGTQSRSKEGERERANRGQSRRWKKKEEKMMP